MKLNLTAITLLSALYLCSCQEEKKEEKPIVKTNYVMPADMIQDKDGNLRLKENSLAPKTEGDKPVKVYPSQKKENGVEVIKVN
ncbi:hypothetical protein [Pedobacter borealis]|uniref:hypothetical protein n=1 Tax=Pedobacter borealis TaxID=475254 RepID=UPI000493014B|nr:hypothetical protein [Pedobacter borealis]